MIIKGTPVDHDVIQVQKSIATNLQNKDLFQSENVDTAENGTELKPPIPMRDCLYVFKCFYGGRNYQYFYVQFRGIY